jgi:hypothetical protein
MPDMDKTEDIGTVAMALSNLPSFTIKLATKTPSTSALNVGLMAVAEDKLAVLPFGFVVRTHL